MVRAVLAALLLATVPVRAASVVRVVGTAPAGSGLESPGIVRALDFFPELFAGAESTIDIAQMYMLYYEPASPGRALDVLYDGLIAAARRGVRVRILLDSATAESNPGPAYGRIADFLGRVAGIEVRFCDLRPYSDYPDCIMHAKYLIIDRRLVVAGSHNWSFSAFTDNLELSLVVDDTGTAARLLGVYEQDWQVAGGGPGAEPDGAGPDRVTGLVVTTPAKLRAPPGRSTAEVLGEMAAGAESTLDVAVNSFSVRVDFGEARRYGFVDSLMRAAAGRGVRVRLLVDRWAREHDPGALVALDSVPGIAVRVLDIRPAGPSRGTGSAHAKLVVADRRSALVGSATLSQRQVEECRNVGLLTRDPDAVATLGDWFGRAWSSGFARAP